MIYDLCVHKYATFLQKQHINYIIMYVCTMYYETWVLPTSYIVHTYYYNHMQQCNV